MIENRDLLEDPRSLGESSIPMSGYQYYEFQCLERTLSEQDKAALRRISSRAMISSTKFMNEYHYGDLKAEPVDMLARYFDVSLYFSNWRERRFGIRFPNLAAIRKVLETYLGPQEIVTQRHGSLVCDIAHEVEEDDEPEDNVLTLLAPLREEILSGDHRSLYMAWLLVCVQADGSDLEPPVPAGLNSPTPAQQSFITFFELDTDLLDAASATSPPLHNNSVALSSE